MHINFLNNKIVYLGLQEINKFLYICSCLFVSLVYNHMWWGKLFTPENFQGKLNNHPEFYLNHE